LLYPSAAVCDTSAVKFSIEVKNILVANCYSCHAAAVANAAGGGGALETYNNVKNWAQPGILLNNIERNPGANPMPKNASKLSNCDIAKIRTWIRNGMLNN
jgi:mono/diheme cytochrome c family protein